ncbi:NHL repeat-containing protein 2-like [Mercenaria mercenaria]|uniref:NHL repeat-containing protein 2-like n=1 Tax=Mercenaria mercenaria TaxID=6596 RepID=UPI00234F2E69|nr:NHL repeat-containing protein 2-like [Mercenaria mercenaria]XP_053407764.1 NHL repeat-containing protein 2-like [Mercenaria mercenaria]
MHDINDVLEACSDLDEKLSGETYSREEEIKTHLNLVESKLKFEVPDFPDGLEWLNVSEPLFLKNHLKGKIVVLDFFTYCCVNCMHILPDLEALESTFSVSDGVAVIGVHSAKFENEKVSANILSAILRYNIHHPVVNDHAATLWSKLQIACWPTLVIVGPSGQFLYQLVGEGHRQKLLEFVRVARQYYLEKGEVMNHDLPIKLEQLPPSPLSFPGKVCVSEDGRTVVVTDTGHHRVIVADKNGHVKHVIGGPDRGNKDGCFEEARFSSPQGLALDGSSVYIADTDNHTIRKADLNERKVVTLAGTGIQGNDKEGGKSGTLQELSSPWDLCIADSIGGEKNAVLYIAMAGTHQIWAYFLVDAVWYKNKQISARTCMRFAGCGVEENRNNSYPEKAGFAQPSGVTLSKKHNCLFIADSESSSIRSIQLKDGSVKNVVGGDIDPRNLFAYGDVDGTGTQAKLQHPLGVSMATEDGPLLIADSYNHKIKSIDIAKRSCQTLLGTGKPGSSRGGNLLETELNEPGGLSSDWRGKKVYIADTNNHDIKVLNLEDQTVHSLPFIFASESSNLDQLDEGRSVSQRGMGDQENSVTVKLEIKPAEGVHLNEEAPNSWKLYSEDDTVKEYLESSGAKLSGDLTQDLNQTLVVLPASGASGELCLKLDLFVCKDTACSMEKKTLKLTLDSSKSEQVFPLELEDKL